MGRNKKNTPAKLILYCVLFTIMVVFYSLSLMNSPYVFVKMTNLMMIIFFSIAIGAFIREIFVLKEKEKAK